MAVFLLVGFAVGALCTLLDRQPDCSKCPLTQTQPKDEKIAVKTNYGNWICPSFLSKD